MRYRKCVKRFVLSSHVVLSLICSTLHFNTQRNLLSQRFFAHFHILHVPNEKMSYTFDINQRWPASFENAISVAAVSKSDNLPVASFSNSNDQVDYAGVGVDVLSFKPDGNYQRFDGTSMASPHVCGFITALMTKNAAYSEIIKDDSSLRKLLNEKFCIDIGAKGQDNATGLGFLTYLTKEEFEETLLTYLIMCKQMFKKKECCFQWKKV